MSPDGELKSADTWEYKPPLFSAVPLDFRVAFLKDAPHQKRNNIMSSKASGEPPMILAGSVLGAVRDAIADSRAERGLSRNFRMDVPATCDRICAALALESKDLT